MASIQDSRNNTVRQSISLRELDRRARAVLWPAGDPSQSTPPETRRTPKPPRPLFERMSGVLGLGIGLPAMLGAVVGGVVGAVAAGLGVLALPLLIIVYFARGSSTAAVLWASVVYGGGIAVLIAISMLRKHGGAKTPDALRRSALAADAHLCAACGYALKGLAPDPDGCTVCPECGAAWTLPKLPRAALCQHCGESMVGQSVQENGMVRCAACSSQYWLAGD